MKSKALLWWGLTAGGVAIIALVLGMVWLGSGGSNGTGIYGSKNGYGMMGGYAGAGGMMGGGYGGMMGSFGGSSDTSTPPLTVDQAHDAVNRYLDYRGNSDLKVREVLEFTNGFYARVDEQSTGAGAFEVLIDRNSGVVSPEPGPNMMWNTKYGMMGGAYGGMMGGGFGQARPSITADMPIKKDDARSRAQNYLDRQLPGTSAGDPDTFYGYYTIEINKDGNTLGMLSVDGYYGQVWYHSWHGTFLSEKQF
ncbi:MAG: hypothetical protein ACYC6Z_03995 [Thermoleophilia bacterium]